MVANNKQTNIDNFTIELPETSLKLDTIHLEYDSLKAFDRFTEQVHFSFRTLPSQVTLKDISPFVIFPFYKVWYPVILSYSSSNLLIDKLFAP